MEKNLFEKKAGRLDIRLNLKTKIWMTVLSVVLMFAFFILFYFPNVQEGYILRNYTNEIQNSANTVALGVKIALTEQNFEGVQTAIDFVKKDPHLEFVSLIQLDTAWNQDHTSYQIKRKVFKTYPEKAVVNANAQSDEFRIVKRSAFNTPLMSGEILLAMNKEEITRNKKQILDTSLIVSSIVFVIGILMGFVLAKNISGPVLRLRDAAKRVSEGDLTQRVSNNSKDEIGELSTAFNNMVMDLDIARKEIISQRDQLKETVVELKNTQQQLIQSEKMASLGELTAGIAHEIQNPLNFVNNFSDVNTELLAELKEELSKGNLEETLSIVEDLRTNEEKINMHGRRADSIVKGMLEHSRSSTGKKEPTDINELAGEFLKLSYHGLRAKNTALNVTLVTHLDPDIPRVNVIPQDIGRVLLNLCNNAFYAVSEKQKNAGHEYKGIVEVTTKPLSGGQGVIIVIKDNGIGVPVNIREKIMQPFFTTKPTGQGTGLGLSLTYDIIVKSYGGSINMKSEEGEGTEFFVSIPV